MVILEPDGFNLPKPFVAMRPPWLRLDDRLGTVLYPDEDYTIDMARGWLFLKNRLEPDEELVVTYTTDDGAMVG